MGKPKNINQKQAEPIKLDEATNFNAVAESTYRTILERELKEIKEKLKEQKSNIRNIMIGAVVVTILFVLGIIWNSHQFMADYNQHYLDTQNKFTEEMNDLRKENADIKETLLREMDKTTDRQDYLERFIMEKPTTRN